VIIGPMNGKNHDKSIHSGSAVPRKLRNEITVA